MRPAPRGLAQAGPHWRSGFALRGLVFQSPNNIYQSDPFSHRFASIAPPRLSALVSPFRARTPVARSAMEASGLVCLRQTSGVSGPPRSARYASSGAPLAALFKDHPPDPCAGNAHPEEFPALKTASIGLRRRELRPQTRSRIVPWPPSRQGYFAPASAFARRFGGRVAGCDPP